MSIGKQCPHCGRDVGFWRVFASAGHRIRCPQCRSRLNYEGAGPVAAAGIAVFVLFYIVLSAAVRRIGASSEIEWLVGFGAGWLLTDVVLTWYLRQSRALVVRERGAA